MPYCCQCKKTYREGVFGIFVCDTCKQKNVARKERLAKKSEKRKQKDKSPADFAITEAGIDR